MHLRICTIKAYLHGKKCYVPVPMHKEEAEERLGVCSRNIDTCTPPQTHTAYHSLHQHPPTSLHTPTPSHNTRDVRCIGRVNGFPGVPTPSLWRMFVAATVANLSWLTLFCISYAFHSLFSAVASKGPVILRVRPVADHLRPKWLPTTEDHWRPWAQNKCCSHTHCGWWLV